jgi:hypothetical protein
MTHLVVAANFIRATRDTGYRGITSAAAELVDNAIDAGASAVKIQIAEQRRDSDREITISVLDDGRGMTKSALWESLRFGGSERFDRRTSLGRYGMGLPNSSVSQAPRVDVYTWRKGRNPLRTHLDVDEIASGTTSDVPEPVECSLPAWLRDRPPSGTLVQWSRCDRLRFKKAQTIARKLRPVLGRMYRVPLAEGLSIFINEEAVSALDPLFRTPVDGLPGTCEPYGDPLEYRIRTPAAGVSLVTVQFVELPVVEWHSVPTETKRARGIVGGAGMSVLRGGREIDYGWHMFGSKRRENYDDWWRAEICFEPALDELIGITHSKQGISPGPELREILEPDLERIARTLNARVRKAFNGARPARATAGAKRASAGDRLLPPLQASETAARRPTGGGFQFRVGFHQDASPQFFRVEVSGAVVQLEINQNHPFYQQIYMRSSDHAEDLEVLLLSAARALLEFPAVARENVIRNWSDNLLAYLGR